MLVLNDWIRIATYTQYASQRGINVHHYRVVDQVGPGVTEQEAADFLSNQIGPVLRGAMSFSAAYQGLKLTKIHPLPPTFPVNSIIQAGVGTFAGDPLPKQCCGLISWQTAFSGRQYRGRTYIPFPPESENLADSTPSPGYLVQLSAIAAEVDGPHIVVGAGGQVTLNHMLKNQDFPISLPITSAVVRDFWATQRRRGDPSGPDVTTFP